MVFGNKEKREEQQRSEQAARLAAQERERERIAQAKLEQKRKTESFVSDYSKSVSDTVEKFGVAHLYWEAYVPVDAQMNSFESAAGLDLRYVNEWGKRGWEIISVVPRTYGGFQSYTVSKSTAYGVSGWGKDTHQVGLGGHVIGVYVLLHFKVDDSNFTESLDVIRDVAMQNLPDELTSPIK